VPLDQVVAPLEITMAWAPTSLWLVPDAAAAEALHAQGVARGRIYTLAELLALTGLTPAEARRRALEKLERDGVVPDIPPT
jgi:hypothetical protein